MEKIYNIDELLKTLAEVQPISSTFFNKPVYDEPLEKIEIRARRKNQDDCALSSMLKFEFVSRIDMPELSEEAMKSFLKYWDELIQKELRFDFVCNVPDSKWPNKGSSFSDEYSKRFVRITGP